MNALNLKVAVSLVNAALAAGRKINAAPLTVAVLDAGGHLLALQREDGASLIRPEVATGKAWGAIAWARARACWRWTRSSGRHFCRAERVGRATGGASAGWRAGA